MGILNDDVEVLLEEGDTGALLVELGSSKVYRFNAVGAQILSLLIDSDSWENFWGRISDLEQVKVQNFLASLTSQGWLQS